MQDPWNSLEIAKLFVAASTPLIVVFVGFILNRNIKKLDKKQWTNQKILEKRLAVYDKVVPILNDILCFHCYVGNWKNISAQDIIAYKRLLDKEMYVYSPLFDHDLMEKYNCFMNLCFQTDTGWGNDAKIKSLYLRREKHSNVWHDSDKELFSEEYIAAASVNNDKENDYISNKKCEYFTLIDCLCSSLEIMQSNMYRNINNPVINFISK
jgi:hypothetical protein